MILSDFKADKLNVKVFETRNELGQEAAKEAKEIFYLQLPPHKTNFCKL